MYCHPSSHDHSSIPRISMQSLYVAQNEVFMTRIPSIVTGYSDHKVTDIYPTLIALK